MLHRKVQIAPVLGGEGRDGDFGIGHVHALAIGNDPANLGHTMHHVGQHLLYPQADLAIVDQQPLAF